MNVYVLGLSARIIPSGKEGGENVRERGSHLLQLAVTRDKDELRFMPGTSYLHAFIDLAVKGITLAPWCASTVLSSYP